MGGDFNMKIWRKGTNTMTDEEERLLETGARSRDRFPPVRIWLRGDVRRDQFRPAPAQTELTRTASARREMNSRAERIFSKKDNSIQIQ